MLGAHITLAVAAPHTSPKRLDALTGAAAGDAPIPNRAPASWGTARVIRMPAPPTPLRLRRDAGIARSIGSGFAGRGHSAGVFEGEKG
jgi:hypothetical protein